MLYPNGTKTKPTVSSPFGPRKATIKGASSSHRGVDFVGFRDIRAVLGGRVTHAGPLGGYGNAVAIDVHVTPELVITHLYGHLASVAVRVGQVVAEGAQLGVMGATGTATGVHLHFEVRHWRGKNLTCIDPLPYLESGVNPPPPAAPKPASTAADNRGTTTNQEESMLLRIKGKTGVRRGGLYLFIGRTATFLGDDKGTTSGVPTVTDENVIAKLAVTYGGDL